MVGHVYSFHFICFQISISIFVLKKNCLCKLDSKSLRPETVIYCSYQMICRFIQNLCSRKTTTTNLCNDFFFLIEIHMNKKPCWNQYICNNQKKSMQPMRAPITDNKTNNDDGRKHYYCFKDFKIQSKRLTNDETKNHEAWNYKKGNLK